MAKGNPKASYAMNLIGKGTKKGKKAIHSITQKLSEEEPDEESHWEISTVDQCHGSNKYKAKQVIKGSSMSKWEVKVTISAVSD